MQFTAKPKAWLVIAVLILLSGAAVVGMLTKRPDKWRPMFLTSARAIPTSFDSIERENPFRIATGPYSSQVIPSGEVSCQDYLINADFDRAVEMGRKATPGWKEEYVGEGRPGTQTAATMDRQFVDQWLALRIYRQQQGNLTRVRVWYRHRPVLGWKGR